MLLKIKPHSPEEKPSHSCKVIAAMTYGPKIMDFSMKYDAWNCEDGDSEEDAELTRIGTDNLIGWVYADEIYWQIINARREAGDEI